MINIDLHIHSYASKYKEAKDVVEMSTVENAQADHRHQRAHFIDE